MLKIKILATIATTVAVTLAMLPAQAARTIHNPEVQALDTTIARGGHRHDHRDYNEGHHDHGKHRGWYKQKKNYQRSGVGRNGYGYGFGFDAPQPAQPFFRSAPRPAPVGNNCTATKAGMICR
jgi:hypothetical protein